MAKTKFNDKKNIDLLLEHAFRQFHAPLYFYALKFIKKEDAAKDIVQDAFLSLLKTGGTEDIENLRAYLYRAVRNNCLNHLKHQQITTEFEQKEKERAERELQFYDTFQTLVEKELQEKLKEAIDDLPEKYRTVFTLSRYEDLSNKEIADKLKLPVRTVETQIYRAIKILRDKFKKQGLILYAILLQKKIKIF